MVRKLLSIFCFLALFLMSGAYAQEETIDVGLRYGNTILTRGTISFDSASKWEIYDGNKYTELFDLTSNSTTTIEKLFQNDSYYVIINGFKGNAINPAISQGKDKIYHAFLNDEWGLVAGPFNSDKEASDYTRYLKKQYPRSNILQISPGDGYTGFFIIPDGNSTVAYVTNEKRGYVRAYSNSRTFKLDNKPYRGEVLLNSYSSSGINVVNRVNIEEYLYGVVGSEMPSNWPIEALKAQAVVSRTYAVKNKGCFRGSGFDVGCGTDSQVYGGLQSEAESVRKAVDETCGQMLFFNGELISSYFHSSSGGYTEGSENVWSTPLPYLIPTKDEYSLGSPYDQWQKQFSIQEAEGILKSRGYSITRIRSVRPEETSQSGRVTVLRVIGEKGDIILKKQEIRDVFQLSSTLFSVSTGSNLSLVDGQGKVWPAGSFDLSLISDKGTIEKRNDLGHVAICSQYQEKVVNINTSGFEFTGSGYGHGVGMSQWGARGMALAGNNYLEILQHYYQNTEVKSFQEG
jgi:stage II sporulation protein D